LFSIQWEWLVGVKIGRRTSDQNGLWVGHCQVTTPG